MSRYERRRTPLHFAVIRDSARMVALLLELGADPSPADLYNTTPLGCTTQRTHPDIVASLIGAGADPKEKAMNRFEHVVPIFHADNVPEAIEYYVGKLGFELSFDWGTPPQFAGVRRGEIELFLCQGGQSAPGAWASIFLQDVDALYEEYLRSGAEVIAPPRDCPWGVREMNVRDPWGNVIRMGSATENH